MEKQVIGLERVLSSDGEILFERLPVRQGKMGILAVAQAVGLNDKSTEYQFQLSTVGRQAFEVAALKKFEGDDGDVFGNNYQVELGHELKVSGNTWLLKEGDSLYMESWAVPESMRNDPGVAEGQRLGVYVCEAVGSNVCRVSYGFRPH